MVRITTKLQANPGEKERVMAIGKELLDLLEQVADETYGKDKPIEKRELDELKARLEAELLKAK